VVDGGRPRSVEAIESLLASVAHTHTVSLIGAQGSEVGFVRRRPQRRQREAVDRNGAETRSSSRSRRRGCGTTLVMRANQDTRRTRTFGKDKGLATRIANPLISLAPRPGLEPGTYGLTVRRSTN
jgi:hypothetical protein